MYQSASAGVMLGNKLTPKLTRLHHTLAMFQDLRWFACSRTGSVSGHGLDRLGPRLRAALTSAPCACVMVEQKGQRPPPGHFPLRAEH